ncbi:MAG: hypothetical protein JST00_14065 [Deltaproteobacteria bacterium]|nr:hypothetical protein [Deltaproteobacteria bacterium]
MRALSKGFSSSAIAALLAAVAVSAYAPRARAIPLGKVDKSPVTLDVTETSIVAQRFEARDGENPNDQGYFAWLNRLNLVLGWKKLTLGARLDSSLYALRPEDRTFTDPQLQRNSQIDGATRFRDAIYPAKLFLTFKTDGLEVTAGDAYVQLGRGLVLSMRKVDELGIDTTLFGGKVVASKDVFALTLIGGLANPARVDEPTGRALFLPRPLPGLPSQPIFGNDRIVGASIQAGRGLPVVASTNMVMLTRCAPYRYNPDGTINGDFFDAPIGTCVEADRSQYLETLPSVGPVIKSRQTINASQSLEVPSLWGHGNFYVEAAIQKRDAERDDEPHTQGNALYGSLVTTGGPISNTLEVKSYRNFYPLAASVNVSRASAFGNIAYSAPPTAEPVITDTMFGFFNACVTGGRDRFDYRLTPTLLAFVSGGFFVTRSEVPGGQCDRLGRSVGSFKDDTTNYVTDVNSGIEWRFDDDKSIAFINGTWRNDVTEAGYAYYREGAIQYSVTKYITGPYSVEFAGRHRYRIQHEENIKDPANEPTGSPWMQGEHQNALKIAPKWIISQAIEYTTFLGLPAFYVNGGILYRFTSESNIRIYAGQNRGGLRCVSGICRMFPAFSGARVELTLRF